MRCWGRDDHNNTCLQTYLLIASIQHLVKAILRVEMQEGKVLRQNVLQRFDSLEVSVRILLTQRRSARLAPAKGASRALLYILRSAVERNRGKDVSREAYLTLLL